MPVKRNPCPSKVILHYIATYGVGILLANGVRSALWDDGEMQFDAHHPWLYPPDMTAAAQVQREMAQRVIHEDAFSGPVEAIGGVDVSNNLRDPENLVYAAIITLQYPHLKLMQTGTHQIKARLPYVPGFLAFREVPALVHAYAQLNPKPDLMLVDGQGISHPRGLGIASHIGVLLDCPTIGVAKSILVGKPEGEPGPLPGDYVPLVWKGNTIGSVLRTKLKTNPVYVSIGHRVSLTTAIEWVMKTCTRYRLPEPTRFAHQAANQFRQGTAIASSMQQSLDI